VNVKELFGKALGWINGPYRALSIVLLAVLLVLFGRDLVESLRVRREINELENRREQLEQRISEDSTLLRNLDDPEFLEKFAREKFLMRREGEELYIVE
jgi:cell division protein FtsB